MSWEYALTEKGCTTHKKGGRFGVPLSSFLFLSLIFLGVDCAIQLLEKLLGGLSSHQRVYLLYVSGTVLMSTTNTLSFRYLSGFMTAK